MRRWPKRSPALPAAGPTTAAPSIGPVTTQVRVPVVVCRSFAMVTSETGSSVTVPPAANPPARPVAMSGHGRDDRVGPLGSEPLGSGPDEGVGEGLLRVEAG